MASAISWFEIPVTEMDRACKFYSDILGYKIEGQEISMGEMTMVMAMLQYNPEAGEIGGALVKTNDHNPSTDGVLVYLNGGEDLNGVLSKIESAGGKVLLPKVPIGENGFMAMFLDTEGNKIGLHSMN